MTAFRTIALVIPARAGTLTGERGAGFRKVLAFYGMTEGAKALAVALLALLLSLVAAPASAQSFPALTGLVVDAANVLPADRKAALEAKLEAFQKESTAKGQGRQLVVATIASLGGDDLADYGYKLGRAWGVGLKGANSGAILFIAPNEPPGSRGPRIEVGYGLEGVLTDAYSSVIINSQMMPRLRGGDVPDALDAGAQAIIDQLSLPDDQAQAKAKAAIAAYDAQHKRAQSGGVPIALIFWVIVIGWVFVGGLIRRRGHGTAYGGSAWPVFLWGLGSGGWGGGGSGGSSFGGGSGGGSGGSDGGWGGGGFTGGGGGSFGGGGASGGW